MTNPNFLVKVRSTNTARRGGVNERLAAATAQPDKLIMMLLVATTRRRFALPHPSE